MARKPALESQVVVLCMVKIGGFSFLRIERGWVDDFPEPFVRACQGNGGRVIEGVEYREEDLIWKM
jgi:hypothetical protein